MSISKNVAATSTANPNKGPEQYKNYELAIALMKARRKGETAFPSSDIETLVEMSLKVVAQNFDLYPDLKGVKDENVLQSIIKLIRTDYDITITARNVNFEFYWEKKCKALTNCKKEDHGGSYKQAFIERRIQTLLESQKDKASEGELIKELYAARYEVFCLIISQLPSHLDMSRVFDNLPNLSYLTLTYGAKHVGMQYERPKFGMKMSDAKIFSECLKVTQSLVYLSLPGNLIDDDLISILIKGLVLNKTISHLDLSHNKISNSGARKIAKFLLSTQVLTYLDLGDNQIHYEGSRYLAQALKVNKVLKHLSLKLNRLDDKAGSKLCIDLLNNKPNLESLSLSSNNLGHMFCESLAEFIGSQMCMLKSLDISCNKIDDSNAATLKNSLQNKKSIIDLDVRQNELSEEIEEEINEIITQNFLLSKNIPYKKLGEYAAGGGPVQEKAEDAPVANTASPGKEEVAAAQVNQSQDNIEQE